MSKVRGTMLVGETPTIYDFQVFPSRWKFFAVVVVALWMLGILLYFGQENGHFGMIPSTLIVVVVFMLCYFTYLGLQREPLVSATASVIQFRSPLCPWRAVSISMNQIESIYGYDETFHDLVVTLFQPMNGDEAKVWRLRVGNSYYFDLTISQIPVQFVAEQLSELLQTAQLQRNQAKQEIPTDSRETPAIHHRDNSDRHPLFWKIYGFLNLALGIVLFVLSFLWNRFPKITDHYEGVPGNIFGIVVMAAIPWILTYTNLGQNSDPEDPIPEYARRLKVELKRDCPIWTMTWYCAFGYVGVTWFIECIFQNTFEPIISFSSAISILTGVWFLFAYPVAIRFLRR